MLRSTARRCNCLMNILSGHVREIVLLLFPRSTRTEPLISLSFNRKMPLKRFHTGWWKKNTHQTIFLSWPSFACNNKHLLSGTEAEFFIMKIMRMPGLCLVFAGGDSLVSRFD